MTQVFQQLSFLAAMGYLIAFCVGLPVLMGRPLKGRWIAGFMLAAFVCQTAAMALRGVELGRCPIGAPVDLLHVVVWSLVVMYACVGTAFRMSLLGLFTSALAALISVTALFADASVSFGAVPSGILIHAWLSLFAYGAFSLLALTAFMYLLQLYGLHRRRWAALFTLLPSLRELEVVNFRLLVVGTGVFTVALGLGAWWYFSGYPIGEAKIALSCVVWAGYVVALALRFGGALYGRRLAVVGVALFLLAMITLYPVATSHVTMHPQAEEVR